MGRMARRSCTSRCAVAAVRSRSRASVIRSTPRRSCASDPAWRKVWPGEKGLRLLAIGGVPGQAYEVRDFTELGAPDPFSQRRSARRGRGFPGPGAPAAAVQAPTQRTPRARRSSRGARAARPGGFRALGRRELVEPPQHLGAGRVQLIQPLLQAVADGRELRGREQRAPPVLGCGSVGPRWGVAGGG